VAKGLADDFECRHVQRRRADAFDHQFTGVGAQLRLLGD
jgi:hypothetical protein